VTAKRQRREYAIASPGELTKERAGRILFVSRALLGRQRAASILSQKCPKIASTVFFFALRSPVAFHVGLGGSTTVRLVRTKGWAALCSFVGVVYVRESVSCCRPPQGYFEGRRLTGLFFLIWAELRYKTRGKPMNGELGAIC
jgi:hypothetical protein